MSIYEVRTMGCGACGSVRTIKVVESANPNRHPPFLDQLLDRSLHRFPCDACGHIDVLEDPMLWTDAGVGLVAGMLPPSQRPGWAELEVAVTAGLAEPVRDEGPAFVRHWGAGVDIRLVFGLEELREKVVAAHAGIDDRAVELCKLPHVDREQAAGPVLERIDDAGGLVLHDLLTGSETTVSRATYDDAVRDIHAGASGHRGLVEGSWVHWLRSPYIPNEPLAAPVSP